MNKQMLVLMGAAVFTAACGGGPGWEPAMIPGETMVPPPILPELGKSGDDSEFFDDEEPAADAPAPEAPATEPAAPATEPAAPAAPAAPPAPKKGG
jgi:hypothetical protein